MFLYDVQLVILWGAFSGTASVQLEDLAATGSGLHGRSGGRNGHGKQNDILKYNIYIY